MKIEITERDDRYGRYEKFEAKTYGQIILADGGYNFEIRGLGCRKVSFGELFRKHVKRIK